MNPADLSRAISCAAAQIDALRAALQCAGPVESMIITPLIKQSADVLKSLEQLKVALRASE